MTKKVLFTRAACEVLTFMINKTPGIEATIHFLLLLILVKNTKKKYIYIYIYNYDCMKTIYDVISLRLCCLLSSLMFS